jgi:hypothetical protein
VRKGTTFEFRDGEDGRSAWSDKIGQKSWKVLRDSVPDQWMLLLSGQEGLLPNLVAVVTAFTSLFMPGGCFAQIKWYTLLQTFVVLGDKVSQDILAPNSHILFRTSLSQSFLLWQIKP